ncbi:MAG TPA: N-acetylmuramoyl-L-alanine amidase [Saprospiraceae bacterium]|nr:N-acetylmuramoyl-L-alanine amidase [Saprospiraceae bacterium]
MKRALIITQTLLFFLSPFAQASFNKTLVVTHSKVAGKVIKEIENTSKPYQIKTVVIDPGHGGHDPGCSGSSSREKHLALAIGLKLEYLLKQKFPDLKVIMTRDEDVFIPLHKRAALANRNQADLFISIHCNFMPGSQATRGTETFVLGLHRAEENLKIAKRENAAILLEEDYEKNYDYDPNSPEGHIMLTMFQSAYLDQSILFAEKAENQMKKTASRRSRGVKQAGFVVLRETTMPSVLVETGFLSNSGEENFLKTEGGQMKIARSLLQAFEEYKQEVESPEYQPFAQPAREVARLPEDKPSQPATPSYPPGVQTVKKTVAQPAPKRVFTNIYESATPDKPAPAVEKKTPAAPKVEETKLPVLFFVQLAASNKPQATDTPRWRALGYVIEVVQEDDLYKYRARNFTGLAAAQKAKEELRKKGFPDAFVVAYKGKQRISLAQAMEETQ